MPDTLIITDIGYRLTIYLSQNDSATIVNDLSIIAEQFKTDSAKDTLANNIRRAIRGVTFSVYDDLVQTEFMRRIEREILDFVIDSIATRIFSLGAKRKIAALGVELAKCQLEFGGRCQYGRCLDYRIVTDFGNNEIVIKKSHPPQTGARIVWPAEVQNRLPRDVKC